ncbi:MAG: hypothetical protein J6Q85_05275 [Clostridia bacterium]|nr:hypothetical protein [Clostridia bacterium]
MKIKGLITAVLLLTLSLSVLVSCENDRDYDEAEVILAAKDLIRKSEPLNFIYYGKGFLFTEDGSGVYKKIDPTECERYGISTIDELKAKTYEVFSSERAALMIQTVLLPIQDEDGKVLHYARYYQHTTDTESYIMVNTTHEYSMTNTVCYDYENISVYDVEGEVIVVNIPVTLTRADGKVKNSEIKIKLIEEETGFRICSASHAVYDENSDLLEELLKK